MEHLFEIEILTFEEVQTMPGAWSDAEFLALLNHIEFADADSIPAADLKEMAIMALTDLDPREAALAVMELRLSEQLPTGKRDNLVQDLRSEHLWETFPDFSLHNEFFHIGCMLNWAFPRKFPLPEVVHLQLRITAKDGSAGHALEAPTPSLLVRILADGLDEHSTLFRLFEDNIMEKAFPEAEHILLEYQCGAYDPQNHQVEVAIYIGNNWVGAMNGMERFHSAAFSD